MLQIQKATKIDERRVGSRRIEIKCLSGENHKPKTINQKPYTSARLGRSTFKKPSMGRQSPAGAQGLLPTQTKSPAMFQAFITQN